MWPLLILGFFAWLFDDSPSESVLNWSQMEQGDIDKDWKEVFKADRRGPENLLRNTEARQGAWTPREERLYKADIRYGGTDLPDWFGEENK